MLQRIYNAAYVQKSNLLGFVCWQISCESSDITLRARHSDELEGGVGRSKSPAFPVNVRDCFGTFGSRETASRPNISGHRVIRKQQSSLLAKRTYKRQGTEIKSADQYVGRRGPYFGRTW